MNDMIKRKDTKHMIVPFDDQTAVCRTARTVVWEGLALRVSPYPILVNNVNALLQGVIMISGGIIL